MYKKNISIVLIGCFLSAVIVPSQDGSFSDTQSDISVFDCEDNFTQGQVSTQDPVLLEESKNQETLMQNFIAGKSNQNQRGSFACGGRFAERRASRFGALPALLHRSANCGALPPVKQGSSIFNLPSVDTSSVHYVQQYGSSSSSHSDQESSV